MKTTKFFQLLIAMLIAISFTACGGVGGGGGASSAANSSQNGFGNPAQRATSWRIASRAARDSGIRTLL